ncbi:hypothetical protein [Rhizobium sp. NFR12]|uniref:hypothetical protein n=1 Tax=Rhizobium sp. NFR12 TaxID=1566261 RepID=UPI000B897BA9|nr:hypothetical protein [Rhizobium sp. NFR12]
MSIQKITSPTEGLKIVYREARNATIAAERLEPLLQLLEVPQEGPSPIEQLQEVLETILTGQRLLHQSMLELHQKVDAIASKRRG